jgi:hypothetical protein
MSFRPLVRAARVLAFAAPVAAVLLACDVSTGGSANVTCEGAGERIDCTVTHTEGSDALEVCWDIVLSCGNGESPAAREVCTSVSPNGTAAKSVALTEFTGIASCDSIDGMTIENQTAIPE